MALPPSAKFLFLLPLLFFWALFFRDPCSSVCPRGTWEPLSVTVGHAGCYGRGRPASAILDPRLTQSPSCADRFVYRLFRSPVNGQVSPYFNRTVCYGRGCGVVGDDLVSWTVSFSSCPTATVEMRLVNSLLGETRPCL